MIGADIKILFIQRICGVADVILSIRTAEAHKNATDLNGLLDRIGRTLQNVGNVELVGDFLAEAGNQLILLLPRSLKDGVEGRIDDHIQHGDHHHQHCDDDGFRMGVFHADVVHEKALKRQGKV